jgi:hypothetical protein
MRVNINQSIKAENGIQSVWRRLDSKLFRVNVVRLVLVLRPAHCLMTPSTELRTRKYEVPVHPNRESKLPNPDSHQMHTAYSPPSNPLHCMYHPPDHGASHTTPAGHSPPFHDSHLTYEYNTACYTPQEWYCLTNGRHSGHGFLFPHPGTHQCSNASLV